MAKKHIETENKQEIIKQETIITSESEDSIEEVIDEKQIEEDTKSEDSISEKPKKLRGIRTIP